MAACRGIGRAVGLVGLAALLAAGPAIAEPVPQSHVICAALNDPGVLQEMARSARDSRMVTLLAETGGWEDGAVVSFYYGPPGVSSHMGPWAAVVAELGCEDRDEGFRVENVQLMFPVPLPTPATAASEADSTTTSTCPDGAIDESVAAAAAIEWGHDNLRRVRCRSSVEATRQPSEDPCIAVFDVSRICQGNVIQTRRVMVNGRGEVRDSF